MNGALIRRAVVRGQLYDDGSIVFGPGLIEAYKLESETAFYPRVVVSRAVCEESNSIHCETDGRDPVLLSQRLRLDADGLNFIDWLYHSDGAYGLDSPPSLTLFWDHFKSAIEFKLRDASGNPKVSACGSTFFFQY